MSLRGPRPRALSSHLFHGEYETVTKATSRGAKRRAGEGSGDGCPLSRDGGPGVSPPGKF